MKNRQLILGLVATFMSTASHAGLEQGVSYSMNDSAGQWMPCIHRRNTGEIAQRKTPVSTGTTTSSR